MANQTYRNFMVHDPTLPNEIMQHAKAIALIGDVFRRPDIDNEIERTAQFRWNLFGIEVECDAIAMAAIVDRRELKSEGGPKRS